MSGFMLVYMRVRSCRLSDASCTSKMDNLLPSLLSGQLNTYVAIVVMFTYNILLDRDFACTCKGQELECSLHMAMPFFIIFVLILWTDGAFRRVCRYTCSCACAAGFWRKWPTCTFRSSFVQIIFKAFFVGFLWVSFVYLDGDWYVCCMNDRSEQQRYLACLNKTAVSDEARIIIHELKNNSRVSIFII